MTLSRQQIMPIEDRYPDVILRIAGLSVMYENDLALDNITFDLIRGERLAVIGPNGAGKSTLIKSLMGLLQAQKGTIQWQGTGHHRLGYVPQQDEVNWNFPVTVRDVVMMGLTRQIGLLYWPSRAHWKKVDSALDRVGMSKFATRQIGELSGGQRRRVFLARALARESELFLLDEPFAGVDVSAQSDLLDVLDDLHGDGLTIVLSTHDLNMAFNRFDRVMALRHRLIALGTPAQVYRPDVLSQLYGGRLATWDDGKQVMLFVDDHACDNC